MRTKWTTGIASVFALGLAMPAAAQDVTFRLGHFDAPTSPAGVYAEAFAKNVAEMSGGSMEVQVFHSAQLGSIPDETAATLDGAQDMVAMSPEFLTSYLPEAKAVALPYMFPTVQDLQAFYLSDRWKENLKTLEGLGAVALDDTWAAMQLEPRGIISRKPVITPDDLTGVTLRIWESNVAIATWEGLGASPTVIPRGETYLAFTQGLADAGPETIGVAYEQKSVEALKYWTRTDEYHQILNVFVNTAKYNGLTPEQQDILKKAATASAPAFQDVTQDGYNKKRDLAREDFDVTIIEPDPRPWRERGPAVVDKLVASGEVTQDIVDYVRSLK
jgi:TRAP-type C4-dicarboxylate transport system substrate-binding protein